MFSVLASFLIFFAIFDPTLLNVMYEEFLSFRGGPSRWGFFGKLYPKNICKKIHYLFVCLIIDYYPWDW